MKTLDGDGGGVSTRQPVYRSSARSWCRWLLISLQGGSVVPQKQNPFSGTAGGRVSAGAVGKNGTAELRCALCEVSTYISEVQCSSACEGEAGGGGHLALADRPAFHTDTNATWDTHFSSHCRESRKRREVRRDCRAAHGARRYRSWVWTNKTL